jgi:Uma2 family endonuclease
MALPQTRVTPEDYLAFERASEEKHEYYAGEIFAMTGASTNHNRIVGSTYAALYAQLRERPCDILANDMRVKVPATGLYTYPDISILCEEPQFEDSEVDTLLNPTVIIEVLSPSTEAYDRGKKFQHYRTIPSFQEYLLISQDNVRVEHYRRQGNDKWEMADAHTLDATITLPSVNCTLRLSDIYEKAQFNHPERLHPSTTPQLKLGACEDKPGVDPPQS